MSPSSQELDKRLCPFCGKPVAAHLTQCPFCREAIPEVRVDRPAYAKLGRAKMRQGLLYMLLAGIVYYFAAGYSGLKLPVAIPPQVTTYLAPLLFLAGLGLALYGVFLQMRS